MNKDYFRHHISKKTAGKWQKCNLVSGHGLCDQRHGLGMNWVDRPRTSADEQNVVWALHYCDCVWAVAGFGCFFCWPLVSSWTFTLIILGLGFLRDRLLRLCCTAVFPPIFLQLRKGPLWSCAELLQSYVLCSSDQCRTVKLRLPAVHELFWGMLGRGDGGWRGIGVSGSGYNELLTLEVRNVVWLRRTKRRTKLPLSTTAPRTFAAAPSFQACLRAFICTFVSVCVYMCMCVCVRSFLIFLLVFQ